jgi:hypothetical protein
MTNYQKGVYYQGIKVFNALLCYINIIIIFLYGLDRLTCSGVDALPFFLGRS